MIWENYKTLLEVNIILGIYQKKKRELISESLVRTLKWLMGYQHTKEKEGWHLTMIENFKYHNTNLFYHNPILIYDVWIANILSSLNALT